MARILLVDDSRTSILIFKGLFVAAGYDVLTAPDGESAFSLAVESVPDLIILDGELPRLSGYEVCRQLRLNAAFRQTKILMVTGGSEHEESRRAQDVGADGFLSKETARAHILDKARLLLAR